MTSFMGNRLIYYRKKIGFTQEVVAKMVYVPRKVIIDLEKNRAVLEEPIAKQLAQIFHVDPSFLTLSTKKNSVFDQQLNQYFEHIITEKCYLLEDLEINLERPYENLSQEIAARLLLCAYFYNQRAVEKAKKIEDDYLNYFFNFGTSDSIQGNDRKYYLLYLIEKQQSEGMLLNCLNPFEELLHLDLTEVEKIITTLKLIRVLFKLSRHVEARNYINKLLDNKIVRKYPHFLAQVYTRKIVTFYYFQSYNECFELLETLEELIEQHSLEEFRSMTYQQKGSLYFSQENNEMATKYFEKALSCISAHAHDQKSILYINLISLSLKDKDYFKVRQYLSNTKNLPCDAREKHIFQSYEAEVLLKEGNTKEHWQLQNKCIEFFIKNKCTRNLDYVYSYIAKYYEENGQYKKAVEYYRKKRELYDEKN